MPWPFTKEENPWFLWVSKQNPGLFAHPDSPDGGTGYGYSRQPGIMGGRLYGSEAPSPWSPDGRMLTVQDALVGYAQFEFDRIKQELFMALSWDHVRLLAEQALGQQSFGIGVCYGIVKNPVMSVVGLVELQKTFIEADLYERATGRVSWKATLNPTFTMGGPALCQLVDLVFIRTGLIGLSRFKASYEKREALIQEVGEAMKDPVAFFASMGAKIKQGFIEKWHRFLDLSKKQTDLRSQFEAGEIFGDVLMEVVMTILLVVSVAGAAVKLASKMPQLVRLAEMVKNARVARRAGGAVKAGEASEATKTVKMASDFAKKPLHNDPVLAPEVEKGSFKTNRPVDMNNLSPEEKAAKEIMEKQGRKDIEQQQQLLSSGDNFTNNPLKKGDKLYGFDTAGRNKAQNSMYWVDEKGYADVKSKYYKDGVWDREGVKNYLALPCYNRANNIVQAEVVEDHMAINSDIGSATERISYSSDSFSTGMYTKPMPGGGVQTTPHAAKITVPQNLSTTP